MVPAFHEASELSRSWPANSCLNGADLAASTDPDTTWDQDHPSSCIEAIGIRARMAAE